MFFFTGGGDVTQAWGVGEGRGDRLAFEISDRPHPFRGDDLLTTGVNAGKDHDWLALVDLFDEFESAPEPSELGFCYNILELARQPSWQTAIIRIQTRDVRRSGLVQSPVQRPRHAHRFVIPQQSDVGVP